MRKIFIGLISIFCSGTLFAQARDSVYLFCYFKGNGDGLHYAWSQDALHWEAMFSDSIVLRPTVSHDKLFRDPCIIKGPDKEYHMVWTVSWADRGIGYAHSRDLVHWSEQQFIPVMEQEDSARNTWAPEITYDKASGNYLIYWASTIAGRFPQKDTTSEGKKYNHRIYYVTTRNFKNWSKPKLLYEPGFSVIDATIIHYGKKYLMFLKNETRAPVEKNIRLATASKITGPWSQPGSPITGSYWAEGPTAIWANGRWIVYFDKYTSHKYGAVSSADLQNWTDISEQVSFPKGTRHGTVFKVSVNEYQNMIQNRK